jgi:hypothetical protein
MAYHTPWPIRLAVLRAALGSVALALGSLQQFMGACHSAASRAGACRNMRTCVSRCAASSLTPSIARCRCVRCVGVVPTGAAGDGGDDADGPAALQDALLGLQACLGALRAVERPPSSDGQSAVQQQRRRRQPSAAAAAAEPDTGSSSDHGGGSLSVPPPPPPPPPGTAGSLRRRTLSFNSVQEMLSAAAATLPGAQGGGGTGELRYAGGGGGGLVAGGAPWPPGSACMLASELVEQLAHQWLRLHADVVMHAAPKRRLWAYAAAYGTGACVVGALLYKGRRRLAPRAASWCAGGGGHSA